MLNFIFLSKNFFLLIQKDFFFYNQNLFLQYFKPILIAFYFICTCSFFFKKLPVSLFLTPLTSFIYFNFKKQNDLFLNYLFFLHPNFLTLNFFILFSNLISLKKKMSAVFLFLLLTGMFWSFQEVLWNGIWDWNVLEFSNLWIALTVTLLNHFTLNTLWKNQITLFCLSILFFFNNFLNTKSVHSFFFLPINKICSSSTLTLFFFFYFFKNSQKLFIFFFLFFYEVFNFFLKQNYFFFNKFFFFVYLFYLVCFKKLRLSYFIFLSVWLGCLIKIALYAQRNHKHFILKPVLFFFMYINSFNYNITKDNFTAFKSSYFFVNISNSLHLKSFFYYKIKQRLLFF